MDAQLAQIEEHEHEHIVPRSLYYAVFAALMVLTALTVGVAFIDLGPLNVVVAIGVAVVKAALVVLFFMHVKYSSRLVQLVVIASVFWLLILFAITLADYLTRGWMAAPQLVR
ncbi:MAG TPA: cytochrome C oxidase subunit IV family protein [Vicinamibacterales bacterium]|nr:cytochrome C oxidase subunit IV family protein [Vicinamibacterales bacterium]